MLVLFVVLLVLFVAFPLVGMTVGAIISTIFVGLIIGALGRLVVPGRQPMSLLATFFAGLIGAVVGGYIGDRVVYTGWFGTTLLEIGVSALVVAALSAPRRRAGVSRVR
jgi:uncharacterized membrane protein YeaQ/YmgE (transglycosylase-associated protein family)